MNALTTPPPATTIHIILLLQPKNGTSSQSSEQSSKQGTRAFAFKAKGETSKMSVNEVKLKQAVAALAVKGTGPATARTFCLGDEDHTLGNAVRHVLLQNRRVEFAGYSVPHPAEPVVQIRVQTYAAPATATATDPAVLTAAEALAQACQTVHAQCEHVLAKLEELLPAVRDDRIRMEAYQLEQEQPEEDEYEEYDDDNDNGNVQNHAMDVEE